MSPARRRGAPGSTLLAVALGLGLLRPLPAAAAEAQVLPPGTWSLDVAYLHSTLDKAWSGDRKPLPLVESVRRYEPGLGLQGILSARPEVRFDIILAQALYGLTDWLTAALYVPIVVSTAVDLNFSWQPGDFQSQLGRQYSEDDFWAWAGSMGQPRPPSRWVGNRFTLADVVLGARAQLPVPEALRQAGLHWAATLSAALPTGRNADPEEAVSVGTNLWELHSNGDFELHLSADQAFLADEHGVPRLTLGADVFGAVFRPRVYAAGHGTKNPLLNDIAPYVGDTYTIAPGSWLGATVSLDFAPVYGPTVASVVSGHDLERAKALPPLLTLSVGYTYLATAQTRWLSDSPLWSWDREKLWQPGDKNILRAAVTVSLLRLGVPVQLYASYRTQELIPGRYTRAASAFSAGARTVFKFW